MISLGYMLTSLMVLGGVALKAQASPARETQRAKVTLQQGYGARPLAFEENRGQTDARVRFLAHGDGYGLFLTPSEAVLALQGECGTGRVLRLTWVGAAQVPRITGQEELPGKIHSLKGSDPSGWRTGIPAYARVRYEGVYPGTDILFYERERRLEYDVVLKAGADLGRMRLAVEGADRLSIDPAGDLVLTVSGAEIRFLRPISYQEIDGARRMVASRYRLLSGSEVGFAVGAYDRTRPLVIDPVLVYSTFLGGSDYDRGTDIAVDTAGNAYVTGETWSPDFPLAGPLQSTGRDLDAFVTKLAPDGSMVYSTYLGGSSGDTGFGIAVDAEGHAYVTGDTVSRDFPEVNPVQPPSQLLRDAFVAKLAPDGSALVYSTYLGGRREDGGQDIAVDTQGFAYVAGVTNSPDFPIVAPLQPSFGGGSYDFFAAKIPPAGGSLVYSTYLGGTDIEFRSSIAVDPQGQAILAGATWSADMPTRNPLQASLRGAGDAYVAKLSLDGRSLVWATYFGGSNGETSDGVAVDPGGHVYMTGITFSTDLATSGAWRTVYGGGDGDAYAARLSPDGSRLLYATYLGGSGGDWGLDIAADLRGSAYVTGFTFSPDFPLAAPIQAACVPHPGTGACSGDAFVTQLAPDGARAVYSTYLGGGAPSSVGAFDGGFGIAVDPRGAAYVTGMTASTDFPTVDAFQPAYGGLSDAFVTKISPTGRPPVCSGATASPSVVWPPNGKLVPVSIRGVTDPDGDQVDLTVTGITQDEPLTGSPDATGVGTATARVRASRAGNGDGRVYRIAFEARDPDGGVCTGTVTVCVPHDRRPGAECRDGGAVVSSSGR
jgi:hypothetical protein